jgi:hypothetical protein
MVVALWRKGGASGDGQRLLVGGAAGQWPKAVRPPGACECGAWRRPGPTCTSHRSPLAPRTDQGSPVCLGVRVRRGTAASRPTVHDVARAHFADSFQGYTIQLNPL